MEIKRIAILFISIATIFAIVPMLLKNIRNIIFIENPMASILAIIFFSAALYIFWLDRHYEKLKSDVHKKSYYIFLIFLFVFILLLSFIIGNTTDPGRAIFPKLSIDSMIPFVPVFVIFYLFYIYYSFATMSFAWYDKTLFRKVIFSWVFLCLISYTVYLLFPTEIERFTFIPKNIFDRWTLVIFKTAPPFNALPSLHASGTVLAMLTLFHFKRGRWLVVPAIMTLLSTVLLKQHYIIDIIAGMLLGALVFWLFFKYNPTPKWNLELFERHWFNANPWLKKLMNKDTAYNKDLNKPI